MAEIRKIKFDKIFKRYKEDEIPMNWYIPAKEIYAFTAWVLNEWQHGSVVKDKDKFLYSLWEYIEEYAIAFGKEQENEENNGETTSLS